MLHIISPEKENGEALTVREISHRDWPLVKPLIEAGDVDIESNNGEVYIYPTASPSELMEMGYVDARGRPQ